MHNTFELSWCRCAFAVFQRIVSEIWLEQQQILGWSWQGVRFLLVTFAAALEGHKREQRQTKGRTKVTLFSALHRATDWWANPWPGWLPVRLTVCPSRPRRLQPPHSQPVLSPCQSNSSQSGKDLLHAASMGADEVCKGYDSDGLALALVLVSLGLMSKISWL